MRYFADNRRRRLQEQQRRGARMVEAVMQFIQQMTHRNGEIRVYTDILYSHHLVYQSNRRYQSELIFDRRPSAKLETLTTPEQVTRAPFANPLELQALIRRLPGLEAAILSVLPFVSTPPFRNDSNICRRRFFVVDFAPYFFGPGLGRYSRRANRHYW